MAWKYVLFVIDVAFPHERPFPYAQVVKNAPQRHSSRYLIPKSQ
jgi:hypothetical protein